MTRFSIVVTAYMAGGTIERAIASALGQTYSAHEVIVIDDGSPDDQHERIVAFGQRIRYIRREVNGGEAAAKNTGVRAATGDYVVLLDSDDEMKPTRLEALAAYIDKTPGADIVTTNAHVVEWDNGERRESTYYPTWAEWPGSDHRRSILERDFIFGAVAVRRDRWLAVGGMNETRPDIAADWPLWARLLLSGGQAHLVSDPLYVYYLTAGSLSGDTVRIARTRVAVLEESLRAPLSADERAVARLHLRHARSDLDWMFAESAVWRSERPRQAMWSVLTARPTERRRRLVAAVGVVAPSAVRRRLGRDPAAATR